MLPLDNADVERLLKDWQVLNEEINDLTPPRLLQLLQAEMGGRRRQSVISRIHGRYTRVRNIYERGTLINGNWPATLRGEFQ